jgi:hypothetical protein
MIVQWTPNGGAQHEVEESGMAALRDLAKTIRSKNAGVDHITFDIIFADRGLFEHVKRSQVITRESMAALYGVPLERISHFFVF